MNPSTIQKETEKKLNGAAKEIGNAVGTVSDRLEKFSHEAGEQVGNFASEFSERASEYVGTSRSYIKENPIQAAAIAVAAGAAVGCLLTLAARRR